MEEKEVEEKLKIFGRIIDKWDKIGVKNVKRELLKAGYDKEQIRNIFKRLKSEEINLKNNNISIVEHHDIDDEPEEW